MICVDVLTLRSAVCTVGAVINEQGQEMKEVNKYDAPEGYVAVKNRDGCAFDDGIYDYSAKQGGWHSVRY